MLNEVKHLQVTLSTKTLINDRDAYPCWLKILRSTQDDKRTAKKDMSAAQDDKLKAKDDNRYAQDGSPLVMLNEVKHLQVTLLTNTLINDRDAYPWYLKILRSTQDDKLKAKHDKSAAQDGSPLVMLNAVKHLQLTLTANTLLKYRDGCPCYLKILRSAQDDKLKAKHDKRVLRMAARLSC